MNILICYATTEGQTRKIARFCATQLVAAGHAVELLPAGDGEGLELASFDAAILAGSVHVGSVQDALARFATDHAEALNRMPTKFLLVSLAAAGKEKDDMADLAKIAAEFCDAVGWKPGATHQVAGAFRFTQYDFFKSWAMRYMAMKYGEKVDPHSDTEYTDWEALAALLKGWPAA